MLFRFMIDSNEETGQNHGASQPEPVIEDSQYLGGFHYVEQTHHSVSTGDVKLQK